MRFALIASLSILPHAYLLAKEALGAPTRMVSKIADPELRKMTLKVLRESPVDFAELARRNLVAKGELFDFTRLEIQGVGARDDSNRFDPKLFDAQIKPSHTAAGEDPGVMTSILSATGLPVDYLKDISEFQKAAKGEMTDRTKLVLSGLQDKEINELVAHSWGCEIVYAAIINGFLRPPKKLFVAGVPDDNFAKWQTLAARTGTQVYWVRATNDAVAIDAGAKIATWNTPEELDTLWNQICSGPNRSMICSPHGRVSATATRVKVGRISGFTGHGRAEYYALLKKAGVLSGSPLDLRRSERAARNAEIDKLQKAALEDATQKARLLLDQAHQERMKVSRQKYDEKVRAIMADMARRSCANPGSVTQVELDLLPELSEPVYNNPYPKGLDDCSLQVYLNLGPTARAEEIRRLSTPVVPIKIKALPPDPVAARPIPPSPFELALPQLRSFALEACRSPESAQPVYLNINDSFYKGIRGNEGLITLCIESSRRGLSGCSLKLYDELVAMVRNGTYGKVGTRDWIRTTVASYSPTPPTGTPISSPRADRDRGLGGESSSSQPPSSKAHNTEGKALQQLREIERRRRWNLPPRP